ncbi:NEK protein kinase, variant [Saprolegnia diclina VS20]|uniref:non-specific serine/threonine protein kinase n=1 Tax=Saprolegnia diclina (strain VS20) TaxID=1156394 RepID=T0QZ40_SAPDV|nr:NEK protein kinase, variant [Saprolegnia diclina VS20]EQC39355.1 NEK protein kinase, variant [Saprolegnia diclina VS20]|eukprot:XP_008607416.1 NEK protein kinase, variant [Saprolegnia diclina VS20]
MDQYDHIRVIGKGSFGVVSKIRRQTDGKELVWKEVGYGQMTEKEKQLIVSEVNILRELRHPHIVRYLDRVIDKQSSKIFIVMEYCEGGDLSQLIKRKRREGSTIEEAFIWQVFTQLYMALKECHRHREGSTVRPILHRDIKPGNIFLDAQSNAKLGDFGLAKELSSESKFAQTNVGTPYYMSPEMVNEMTYDERSDIWALGCLLYEMAALAPPFDATNQLALAKKINAGKFARIPDAYSEDLFQAIKWMLHRQRSRRPRIEDLERIPQLARRLQTYSMSLAEASLHETYTAKMKELLAIEEELRRQEAVLLVRESQIKEAEDDLRRRELDVKKRERLVETLSRTYSNSSPNNSSCHSGSSDHSPVCSHCGSSSSYSGNNNDVHLSLPTPPRKSRSYESASLKGTPSRHFRFDEYSPTKYTPPPTSRYYPSIESPVKKSHHALDRYYQQA